MEIAIAAGFRYGARLPATVYGPVYFADQDWRAPNRAAYMAALAQHRPYMGTVIDWTGDVAFMTVLDWAEEASQYVERVLLVPKVQGGIDRLPRQVNGKDVILAYSVPTRFGGTELPVWEFAGWPVHLLGGSPHRQMKTYRHLAAIAEVVSADGNYFQLKATRFCEHWEWPGRWAADGGRTPWDAPYAAFERSCQNIVAAWGDLCSS